MSVFYPAAGFKGGCGGVYFFLNLGGWGGPWGGGGGAHDSGLQVDALDGAPGVHSARFAGESATDADNVTLLLAELDRRRATDASQRTARFRCVLVLRWPDGRELVTEGAVEGRIAPVPSGDGGFGYDPVFVPTEGDGRTFAAMTGAEKQAISHRGRALRDLVRRLAD